MLVYPGNPANCALLEHIAEEVVWELPLRGNKGCTNLRRDGP